MKCNCVPTANDARAAIELRLAIRTWAKPTRAIRNTGGRLEFRKISDLAELALVPMCAHDSAAAVANIAVIQCTVRNFLAAETMIGTGGRMDDVVEHDGPLVTSPAWGSNSTPTWSRPTWPRGESYRG